MKKSSPWFLAFRVPLVVFLCLIATIIATVLGSHLFALIFGVISAMLGGFEPGKKIVASISHGQFALDYIAFAAIVLGIATGSYVVVGIISLMLSGGEALEDYAMAQARTSLTALTNRIPKDVYLWRDGAPQEKIPIATVAVGQEIFVRKGEIIPLDGTLLSSKGLVDESSLTGEPYPVDKLMRDPVRSGTANVGESLVVRVDKSDAESTYRAIIHLVEAAQREKPTFLRLADQYSVIFTLVTVVLSIAAFALTDNLVRVLDVLVIATPCPLILAAPIALFGGMNAAARQRILLKNLASIEALNRVSTIIFDKTGTLTLGTPTLTTLTIRDKNYSPKEVYSIAEALERHSLHPVAAAIIAKAKAEGAPMVVAEETDEKLGFGIQGTVDGKRYSLARASGRETAMQIDLHRGKKLIASFIFEDHIKSGSIPILKRLIKGGISVAIFTGDKEKNVENLVTQLGTLGKQLTVKANCTPEDKERGIAERHRHGEVVAMVGDGINDAPALALADVGMVFSHEEQTAALEAADIVFLGGDMVLVSRIFQIAKRSLRIANQSIVVGIGLSIVGMIVATLGYLPASIGALVQEGIDILVILNALRASW